eukprot:s7542_g4.t1
MDDDTPDGSMGLSVAAIGNIVRREIERGLAPVEQKLNQIHNILDERIDKIESTVGEQGGHDAGLVLEMFKLGLAELHECLLDIYNRMLVEESLEPSWQHTVFEMLPKPGDSTQETNWRPIAVLRITYKVCAKLLGARIRKVLESARCADQVGFRSKLGIDHAFAVLETMIVKSIEWDTPLWCANLDLKKAFDRTEHHRCSKHLMTKVFHNVTLACYPFCIDHKRAGKSLQYTVESSKVTYSVRRSSTQALNLQFLDGRAILENMG